MAQAHPAEIPAVQSAQCRVDRFSHGERVFTTTQLDEGCPCTEAPWVIRIWERKGGRLHAVGEHAVGLSGPIAWQPNGRHLFAACRRADGQPGILLYESNGLQHGSFDLHGQGEACPQLPYVTSVACFRSLNSQDCAWSVRPIA